MTQPPPNDAERLTDLVWRESVRALAAQETELAAIHLRASFVLAASGVAAGALAQSNRHGAFAILALIAFLAAGVLAVATFLPRRERWRFHNNARSMLTSYVDAGTGYVQTQRWLAEDNQDSRFANKMALNSLYELFFWASLAVVVGIFLAAFDILVD
jgi:hypothetical protein